MIQRMLYRAVFQPRDDVVRDAFDGKLYRELLERLVMIDGQVQDYCYFSDQRDIALALALDGFLLFGRRRSGPSAMPILLQNLNLPPEIRMHLEHLICVGVIPGPRQPKDL